MKKCFNEFDIARINAITCKEQKRSLGRDKAQITQLVPERQF